MSEDTTPVVGPKTADLEQISMLVDIATKTAPAVFPGFLDIHGAVMRELTRINAAFAVAWAKKQADDKAKAEAKAAEDAAKAAAQAKMEAEVKTPAEDKEPSYAA